MVLGSMLSPELRTHDTRHAANESVHRTMNERRENAAPRLATSMRCECECFRAECGSSFEITIADYEAVRADGRHFVVIPGHESDDESIISRTESYFVIEKTGEQGRMADSLDPR
jgi:hypothetical protein